MNGQQATSGDRTLRSDRFSVYACLCAAVKLMAETSHTALRMLRVYNFAPYDLETGLVSAHMIAELGDPRRKTCMPGSRAARFAKI